MTASKDSYLKKHLVVSNAMRANFIPFQVLCVDRVPAVAAGERLRGHRAHRLQVQDGRAPLPRLQPRHGRLLHGVRTT